MVVERHFKYDEVLQNKKVTGITVQSSKLHKNVWFLEI
jgi:hypothetical protein